MARAEDAGLGPIAGVMAWPRRAVPGGGDRAAGGAARLCAQAVVMAAMLFNLVLCAAATRGLRIAPATVAVAEVLIVAAALALAWRGVLRHLLIAGVLIALGVGGLWLADPLNDPKIAVELAIMGGFACLGLSAADRPGADRLMWLATMLILAVGVWEMAALPSFEHYFDIFGYYVDKGALAATQASDTGTRLAENGMRPGGEGRQLLGGLLGLHRVGSIFLEPISAGNFTVICVAWVLARGRVGWDGWLLMAAALAIGVLADARFSVVSSLAVAAMLLSGAWRARWLVAALPVGMIGLLIVIGVTGTAEIDNSIAGRLVGSGRLLAGWSPAEWFGLTAPGGVSMDTGYSYVLGNLGVAGALALWLVVALRRKPVQAARFFAAIAVYFTLALSTSSSCLSIKTAALLWFLYGTLLAGEDGALRGRAAARNSVRTR